MIFLQKKEKPADSSEKEPAGHILLFQPLMRLLVICVLSVSVISSVVTSVSVIVFKLGDIFTDIFHGEADSAHLVLAQANNGYLIAKERINRVEDVLTLGDKVTVVCLGKDKMGRMSFSIKDVPAEAK